MKDKALESVVASFGRTKDGLRELTEMVGFKAITCVVKQKGGTVWNCQELDFDPESGVLTGLFYEMCRDGGNERLKQIRVFLDGEGVESIEFETYETYPEGRCLSCGQNLPSGR